MKKINKPSRANLSLPADAVAQSLIGAVLTHRTQNDAVLAGVITETEAYTGPEDQCSHAKNGRRTERNASMWARPGTAYVYFTYGMHWCFNISCYREDHPATVLIRAIHPIRGLDTIRAHRTSPGRKTPLRDADLCNGPAKLCRALAIDGGLDGEDLTTSVRLTIREGIEIPPEQILNTPRIGVGSGHAWADAPLRWVVNAGWIRSGFGV